MELILVVQLAFSVKDYGIIMMIMELAVITVKPLWYLNC